MLNLASRIAKRMILFSQSIPLLRNGRQIRSGSFVNVGCLVVITLFLVKFAGHAWAQVQPSGPTTDALKRLSLEELMDIEVTSVSRRPEELAKAASAIQVITPEDIRRSGATRLPEALRLATNLAVDQLDSTQWAISARGFNSPLANKLLVLIDGRTVYSPL